MAVGSFLRDGGCFADIWTVGFWIEFTGKETG